MSASSKCESPLVVKVSDVSDVGQRVAAINEKSILQSLDSPYINKYVGFYEDPFLNMTYLVVEHAGDKNLAEFVQYMRTNRTTAPRGRPLGGILIRSIMTQLFEAIDYLHRNKICHRDLKPDNILVRLGAPETSSAAVTVKIIDFNVAVRL